MYTIKERRKKELPLTKLNFPLVVVLRLRYFNVETMDRMSEVTPYQFVRITK